jgi:arabinofuranan 3-O-arabinosyltransferase
VADLTPAGMRHRLQLDYQTVRGRGARLCVWQVGPNRCANLPDLAASEDWTTYDVTFEPAPGTTALRLYLYADGNDGRLTVTRYRDPTLTTPSPVVVVLTQQQDGGQRAPATEVSRESPSRYSVAVRGSEGRFVLAFAETFAPGWKLTKLPAGWSARHVEVDGYANGWEITGRGDATFALRYRPAALASAGARVSATALVAVVLVSLVAGIVRRRGSGRRRAADRRRHARRRRIARP